MGNYDFEALKNMEKKSRAKLEFLTIEDDCRAFLARGFSMSTVYQYLKEGGRISMTYDTFIKYLRKRKTALPKNLTVEQPIPPKKSVSSTFQEANIDEQQTTPLGVKINTVKHSRVPRPGLAE